MHPKRMNPKEVSAALDKGALLVDVRTYADIEAFAFVTDHQVLIPITEFAARYQELPKDTLLIMACNVGVNSLKTGYYLLNMGYSQVANLEGGIEAWDAAGFPVKKNPAKIAAAGSCCCGGGAAETNSGCCGDDDSCEGVTENELNSGGCCG